MKYHVLPFLLFINSIWAFPQKNIDGLLTAERSFAALAVQHGMKEAFLKFSDSNAIMFDKGKPINALQLWNARENRAGILNWRPEYVEIAASNDFGYTSVLWTFQPKTTSDSIAARGRFITVWHINEIG